MRATNGFAPQLTWVNIISTVGVLFTIAGGSYLLVQQQFGAMERQFKNGNDLNTSTINDLKKDVETLHGTIVIGRAEHTEFVKRIDEMTLVIREQLRIIETTRPTTGELQAIGQSTKEQLSEIKERLRSLEDYNRRPQSLAPVTQPQQSPH